MREHRTKKVKKEGGKRREDSKDAV